MRNFHPELEFTTCELEPPTACIYVQRSTMREGGSRRYITPDCKSPAEMDEAIKRLHAELDNIQKQAHARYAADRQKIATH